MGDAPQTPTQLAHLNAVLRGVRDVHRLIARERDPDKLLGKAATALVQARGFRAVAMVRTEGGAVVRSFVEGDALQLGGLRGMLSEGTLPACLREAALGGASLAIADAGPACPGCPGDRGWTEARDALAVPIEHEGRRHGAVMVALPPGAADRPEELELLRELAGDLGLAVHNLGLQEALRESERRYRLIMQNTMDVVWVQDLETSRFTYVSPSVERLRGYPVGDFLGDAPPPMVTAGSAAYLAAVTPARLRAFERGECPRYVDEIERPHRDGSTVWTETATRFARDEGTGHAVAYGTSRDITARRRAELALRESEARFRAIFEDAAVGVAQVETRTGRFVLVNDKYCEILGRTRAEVLAGSWRDVTLPADLDRDQDRITRLIAGEFPAYQRQKRYIRGDGEVVWVHLTVSRMWSDGEEPRYHVTVVEDISARKQAEAALLETQAELRTLTADLERRVVDRTAALDRAAHAKDEFLASMSHELRTPLNGILGVAEALAEGVYGPFDDRQAGALGRIDESGRHLLALINDILDVAKVEAGKIELELYPVSVADLCRASLRLVQEPAARKHIGVAVTIDPALPPVVADERRLKQVLVNLLTNAVKFTPEGGSIGVDVDRVASGQALRITVWDTGVGIAPEDQPRLFRPFVQLDNSLSRQHVGTGLGLALVRRLVELHGGEVRVESEVGRGSRFIVSVPLRPRPEAAGHAAPATRRPPTPPLGLTPGLTVLVADDDDTNLLLLRDVLEHAGYTVHEAHDGREAVAQANALRPDVILMDVQMPVLDGLAATQAIRASAPIATTPIIALTALAMRGDEARCRAAGADDYLSKPVALPRLLAMMERLATRPR
jgi:PAS domain S-box-containing protein